MPFERANLLPGEGYANPVLLWQVLDICGGPWLYYEGARGMGKEEFKPHPDALRTVFIHSLNICEFTSTTRWGEYSGECSARALAMELLTD